MTVFDDGASSTDLFTTLFCFAPVRISASVRRSQPAVLLSAASRPTEPEAVSSEMTRPPFLMAGPAGRKGNDERGWLLTWTIAALPKAVK
jgi:hypothetical protein